MNNLETRKHLTLGHSSLWIKRAFIVFREKPIQFFVLEILTSILTITPFLGSFLGPLLVARFMDCAYKVESQHRLRMGEVFSGMFSNKVLVRLAFLNFGLNAIILLIQYFIEGQATGGNLVKPTVLMLILTIPSLVLTMSMWLSPAICLFNQNVAPKHAMLLSIKACFNHAIVFLAFSIIVAGVSLIIFLPAIYLITSVWDGTHSIFLVALIVIVAYVVIMVWFAILNLTTYFVYKTILNFDNFIK